MDDQNNYQEEYTETKTIKKSRNYWMITAFIAIGALSVVSIFYAYKTSALKYSEKIIQLKNEISELQTINHDQDLKVGKVIEKQETQAIDIAMEKIEKSNDWKIYENEEYQFELTHPSKWTLSEGGSEGEDYKLILKVLNPEHDGAPDTDAPIEQILVRSENKECEGQPIILDNKIGTNNPWQEGLGEITYRDLCFGTDGWAITISASAFDAASEELMDSVIASLKFKN